MWEPHQEPSHCTRERLKVTAAFGGSRCWLLGTPPPRILSSHSATVCPCPAPAQRWAPGGLPGRGLDVGGLGAGLLPPSLEGARRCCHPAVAGCRVLAYPVFSHSPSFNLGRVTGVGDCSVEWGVTRRGCPESLSASFRPMESAVTHAQAGGLWSARARALPVHRAACPVLVSEHLAAAHLPSVRPSVRPLGEASAALPFAL